jgi:hypothetical protein
MAENFWQETPLVGPHLNQKMAVGKEGRQLHPKSML